MNTDRYTRPETVQRYLSATEEKIERLQSELRSLDSESDSIEALHVDDAIGHERVKLLTMYHAIENGVPFPEDLHNHLLDLEDRRADWRKVGF